MKLLIALIVLFLPAMVAAQQPDPKIEAELSETEVVPGQAVSLRLTVLVPTWMPNPPEWPTFESPNLLVRLPDRATSPISKTIEGETWSGITRRYQIIPMVPGEVVIPEDEVIVTYADPGAPDPIRVSLPTEVISIIGLIPSGAEDMDPFFAARSVTLKQKIDGTPTGMEAGESFSRTIVMAADGVPSMFLPSLTPEFAPAGLKPYADEAKFEDSENRGLLSGQRTERTVYLAENAVDDALPDVSVEWFNIETGEVETATLPAVEVQSSAPPAPARELDQRKVATWIIGLMIVSLLTWGAYRVISPTAKRLAQHVKHSQFNKRRILKSRLIGAIDSRDLPETRQLAAAWVSLHPGIPVSARQAVSDQLSQLGAIRYGKATVQDEIELWSELRRLLTTSNRTFKTGRSRESALPELNPHSAD